VTDAAEIPGFLYIDHIAVTVRPGELERQVEAYKKLGFSELHREDVGGADQVREVLLRIGPGPNAIQLLEPLSPESPVAKQIERADGNTGIAHLALRVRDIRKTFDYMQQNGFKLIDPAPRRGSRGTMVFFVHPKGAGQEALGYLLEVVQAADISG
jgi:methylmalonyl-CoA/ethylmalonyl-CoA epimerase